MIRILPFLLLLTLMGCQGDYHPAVGEWRGELLHNGGKTDLGRVFIGKDRIDMPDAGESYRQLAFFVEADEVRFGRKMMGNFQGEGSVISGAGRPEGSIQVHGKKRAEMRINLIQGVLKLSR